MLDRASWVVLAAALLMPAAARADKIPGPPACPPGSHGRSSHSGQWCEPWSCTSDADCGSSATCRPWRVCTRGSDVRRGGDIRGPNPPQRMRMVVGTCDASVKCKGDEEPPPSMVGTLVDGPPECAEASYCVDKALPALPSRTTSGPASAGGGCGCRETTSAPVLALVLAPLVLRRRRGS